jgi:hypothetical protein
MADQYPWLTRFAYACAILAVLNVLAAVGILIFGVWLGLPAFTIVATAISALFVALALKATENLIDLLFVIGERIVK